MVIEKEIFQYVTTYKLVLRKLAMQFPEYDHGFDLPSAEYSRKSDNTKYDRLEEVRELDYGRVDAVGELTGRSMLSNMTVLVFALIAIVIAIIFISCEARDLPPNR